MKMTGKQEKNHQFKTWQDAYEFFKSPKNKEIIEINGPPLCGRIGVSEYTRIDLKVKNN